MLSRGIFSLFLILCALLCTCSDDNDNPTYPFDRSILEASVAKRCKDGTSKPGANCYLMHWQHPIETNGLQNYYIWIDTTVVKDSVQEISQTQMSQAAKIIGYNNKKEGGDSLDLTDLISEFLGRDSLHVAIWARYSGSEQGSVRHLHIYFGDDVKPSIVSFSDSAASDKIWINWMRPTDQKDFYFPDSIDGPIAGYNVTVTAEAEEDIRDLMLVCGLAGEDIKSEDLKRFHVFRKSGRGVRLEETNKDNPKILRFAIIDGKGFVSDTNRMEENAWKIEIRGLKSERSYNISMTAYDSAGNSQTPNSRSIKTTDAIAPLIASKFRLYADSGDGLPRLDSNRLILFWPRSVDPLNNSTEIKLDSNLYIPPNYRLDINYKEVKKYSIEQWNGASWESIPRVYDVSENYYNARYRFENDSMKLDSVGGNFISDTLRWVLPGDTIILRIRAIDNSGYYSKAWIETIVVSKGELWQHKCPPNFVPIKMDSSVFCMEKLENELKYNVLYIQAKSSCEALSGTAGFEDFSVSLCTEQQWNAACAGGSRYGVIEEQNFNPNEFLFSSCGVGTGDSASANNIAKRSKICANRNGIRDLPGQLQEWVIGTDTGGVQIPLLKGSSYAVFEGVSRVELAQCGNKFTPTRIRPRYTEESVYLYRSGSRIDTLLTRDTLRTIYAVLTPDKFTDTLLVYDLESLNGDSLGIDYVNQAEYRRRGGDAWLEALWKGLNYKPKEKRRVLILGTESINASNFFLDPTVGFRCCAKAQ